MIRVVHPGSRIRMLTFCPSRIPDPGVKKAPDPGSGSATLFFCRRASYWLYEDCGQSYHRVKLVEKEKKELEGPMREAVGHLRLENSKTHLLNQIKQRQIMDTEDAVK
jgi:hypothetical protein